MDRSKYFKVHIRNFKKSWTSRALFVCRTANLTWAQLHTSYYFYRIVYSLTSFEIYIPIGRSSAGQDWALSRRFLRDRGQVAWEGCIVVGETTLWTAHPRLGFLARLQAAQRHCEDMKITTDETLTSHGLFYCDFVIYIHSRPGPFQSIRSTAVEILSPNKRTHSSRATTQRYRDFPAGNLVEEIGGTRWWLQILDRK